MKREKKLFYVEFGEPRVGGMSFMFGGGNAQEPVFVIAYDYNEAAEKAIAFAEYKKTEKDAQSILTPDGSLKQPETEEIKIKSISIASEEIIW